MLKKKGDDGVEGSEAQKRARAKARATLDKTLADVDKDIAKQQKIVDEDVSLRDTKALAKQEKAAEELERLQAERAEYQAMLEELDRVEREEAEAQEAKRVEAEGVGHGDETAGQDGSEAGEKKYSVAEDGADGVENAELVKEVSRGIADFAKAMGREVVYDGDFRGGNERGYVDESGVIHINPGMRAAEQAAFVLGHEFTHTLEGTKEYQELIEYIKDSKLLRDFLSKRSEDLRRSGEWMIKRDMTLDDLVKHTQSLYDKAGIRLDSRSAEREIVADMVSDALLGDESRLKEFVHRTPEAKNVLRKLLDAVRRWLKSATNAQYRDLKRLADRLQSAIDASNEAEAREATALMEGKPGLTAMSEGYEVAKVSDKGQRLFNLSSRDNVRKRRTALLQKSVESGAITKEMAEGVNKFVEEIENAIFKDVSDEEFARRYAKFADWQSQEVETASDGTKYLFWGRNNTEYPMNIDPSKSCVKRDDMNAILDIMFGSGMVDVAGLDRIDYAKLRKIMEKHGLQLTCSGCYVDNSRARTFEWAQDVASGWNELVMAGLRDATEFGVMPLEENRDMDWDAMYKRAEELGVQANPKKPVRAFREAVDKMRKDATLRHLVNPNDLVSPSRFNSVYLKGNPLVKPALQKIKAMGTPTVIIPDAVYDGDITGKWVQDYVITHPADSKKVLRVVDPVTRSFELGGVRIQSNSDFRNVLFLDYVQCLADIAAKGMAAHGYTKVPAFARLFGMTGVKINMSLFPSVEGVTPEMRERWKQLGDEKVEDPDFIRLSKRAGLSETDPDGYCMSKESFPKEEAFDIEADPRYAANCGTIMVVVSDRHYWACQGDRRIKFMIPFHASNETTATQEAENTDLHVDYSKHQNTCRPDDKHQRMEGESLQEYYARLGQVDEIKAPFNKKC